MSKRNEKTDMQMPIGKKHQRDGVTQYSARKIMRERNYFAAMMVNEGDADALISGYSQ
jgi:malate dehydrogenase (oxaloacetate-decarboxylating)(NADP+)